MYNTHDPQVLPIRDGVKPSCVVLPTQGSGRVLDYLLQRLPAVSEQVWVQRMQASAVRDEFGNAVLPDTPFLPGVRIYYYRTVEIEPLVPFDAQVIYQDDHLVIADKPHFLPVVPGGRYLQNTLLVRLKKQLNLPDLSPVHRIDRDTAGLVMFSVQRQDRGRYQTLFRDHLVRKTYEAVAPYRADVAFPRVHRSRMQESGDFIRMKEVPSEQPNSSTEMAIAEHNGVWARYELHPVSGKRHQLRVHMAALGLGLRGDALYPAVRDVADGDFSQPLQLLAKKLVFTDPVTGTLHETESRLRLQALPAAA